MSEIITASEAALKQAARKSGRAAGNPRGHVSSGQVGVGNGARARRAASLPQLTVQGPEAGEGREGGRMPLRAIVVDTTTEKYVGHEDRGPRAAAELA